MRPALTVALALAPALVFAAGPARGDEPSPPAETAPADPAEPSPESPAPPEPTPAPAEAAPQEPAPVISTPPPPPWRFTGTLGVVSLPRLLSLELLARFRRKDDPRWDLFAFGAGIEYLPPGLADFGETTTVSWLALGPDARFFFYRWAFVGARLGYQFVRADSEKFGSEVDYITASFFVAPKAGVLYTFSSGLTIGGELGATIPIAPETTLESDGTQDSNARKVSKTFGEFVIPFASLFRVGWTI